MASVSCESGGIGRRAGFRFLCRKAYGFDSRLSYQRRACAYHSRRLVWFAGTTIRHGQPGANAVAIPHGILMAAAFLRGGAHMRKKGRHAAPNAQTTQAGWRLCVWRPSAPTGASWPLQCCLASPCQAHKEAFLSGGITCQASKAPLPKPKAPRVGCSASADDDVADADVRAAVGDGEG